MAEKLKGTYTTAPERRYVERAKHSAKGVNIDEALEDMDEKIDDAITGVYSYKGSVQTYDDLPTTEQKVGDVYNVLDTGKNYAWTGTDWDELGGHIALYTDNIQALTTRQINSLKCGDVVIKLTNNQQHCYIVTYKENNVGICMSYYDAGYVETISYDYVGTDWVYNSKDSTTIQPKLTAGSNVQINNGVISATNTTYTAGSGIVITDGVISSTGGDLYENILVIKHSSSSLEFNVMLFTTTDLTALTQQELNTYVINHLSNAQYPVYNENSVTTYRGDNIVITSAGYNGSFFYIEGFKYDTTNTKLAVVGISMQYAGSPNVTIRRSAKM